MIESTIRKSGNSTVLVIPPEDVKERKVKIGEKVEFEVFKRVDLASFYGKGKHLRINAQKAKNQLRKEW